MHGLKPDLGELASRLEHHMGPESQSPETSAFVIQAARMLAEGEPLKVQRVSESLRMDGNTTEAAVDFLNTSQQLGYTPGGLINAVAGLSLVPTRHRFNAGGKTLYTWCAIDALFFPELLGIPARIESPCPESGQVVCVEIAPETGIVSLNPGTAVVSVAVPAEDRASNRHGCETQGAEEDDHCSSGDLFGADGVFCSRVFFFQSLEEAERWHAEISDVEVLCVRDAYELAINAWANPLKKQASLY